MPLPELVIFDCDGVLVDTESPGNRHLAMLLTEAGYPIDHQTCMRRFGGVSMSAIQAEVEGSGVRLGEDFVERWNESLPVLFKQAGVTEIPFVRGFIEEVHAASIATCVATSARLSKAQLTLGLTGLISYFDGSLFSASMVGKPKPFPDLFLHAAKTKGAAPADCIVIEDSVPGVQAAVAAGMTVYAYHGDPHADVERLEAEGGILFDDMRKLSAMVGLA